MAIEEQHHHLVGRPKGMDAKTSYHLSGEAVSGLPTVADGGTFTVLGIETSCDDTGAAVVRSDGVILGESLASQYSIHEEFGGVVPGLARDAHAEVIEKVIGTALKEAGMGPGDVDAVAATVGPGLEICLRVGATAGRSLATAHAKPFVAVHHLEVSGAAFSCALMHVFKRMSVSACVCVGVFVRMWTPPN